jgi:transcriptional regulator with XRE-family HTH domain
MQSPSKKEELELPRRIAALRKNAGMTQAKLGEKIGVHGDTLARYERGVRRVAPDLLELLITTLKLDDEQAARLRAAREFDEPYWARGMRTALAQSSGTEPTFTLSADPATPPDPAGPESALPVLLGAKNLETTIALAANGGGSADVTVRYMVNCARLLALGKVDDVGLAHLFHYTVPFGNGEVEMLPVFTSMENMMSAVAVNPHWAAEYKGIVLEGSDLLGALTGDEFLVINPWSDREYRLPARRAPKPPDRPRRFLFWRNRQ